MTEVAKIQRQEVEAHRPADPMISMIERVVTDPNADLAKLERMLDMRERVEQREARRAFDQAIAAAKADIGPIQRTGFVDYEGRNGGNRTHFKHETLDGIAKAIDPILSQNGLSYRFRSEQMEGGRLRVTCIIAHRDGHSEETALEGAPDTSGSKNSYQAIGSAATYLQRYTLKLALGLSAAKDDDGQAATPKAESVTEDQFRHLRDLMEKAGADEGRFLKFFKVENLEELPRAKYGDAEAMLAKKIRESGDA